MHVNRSATNVKVLKVLMLTKPWNALGFDGPRTVFRHTRYSIDAEALTRVGVFNSLCTLASLGVYSRLIAGGCSLTLAAFSTH